MDHGFHSYVKLPEGNSFQLLGLLMFIYSILLNGSSNMMNHGLREMEASISKWRTTLTSDYTPFSAESL